MNELTIHKCKQQSHCFKWDIVLLSVIPPNYKSLNFQIQWVQWTCQTHSSHYNETPVIILNWKWEHCAPSYAKNLLLELPPSSFCTMTKKSKTKKIDPPAYLVTSAAYTKQLCTPFKIQIKELKHLMNQYATTKSWNWKMLTKKLSL